MADDQMRRVDLVKDKKLLNSATQAWMKYIEKENIQRVEKLRKLRMRNTITSLLLGSGVLAIYTYTIISVKQETFLDDFEVPQLLPKQEEN